MKFILTLLLLFSFGALSSLNAQQRSPAQPGVQQFILQYGDILELTDQQKSELLMVQADRRSAMQSDRQRGSMTGQRGRMDRQRPAVRGQQRGALRSNTDRSRRDRPARSERRGESIDAISDILTNDQQAKLHEVRVERIEARAELLKLQNRTMVEKSISDTQKAEEVTGLLNQIVEIQKDSQLYRLENRGDGDREKMVENVAEIRSIQDELKSKITVAEYQSLRPVFTMGQQRQRSEGRGVQRNR